jgi:hypothetical protein
MIQPIDLVVLRQLFTELKESQVIWAVTGSLSFALQGLPLEPHDIDIQTDTEGAYEIERRFSSQMGRKVAFSSTKRMRSHFGALLIEGIVVEIMGDIQSDLRTARGRPRWISRVTGSLSTLRAWTSPCLR